MVAFNSCVSILTNTVNQGSYLPLLTFQILEAILTLCEIRKVW
jgi:hypothetical protein